VGLSRRRLTFGALGLILIAALAIWLAVDQTPLWTAAHAGWFPPGQVGACAAVASLRTIGAARAKPQPLTSEMVDAAASALATLSDRGFMPTGDPIAVTGMFPGSPDAQRQAWLFIGIGTTTPVMSIRPVGLVYIDGIDWTTLDAVVGLDDPAARCDFNLRRALRTTLLAPPTLLLGITFGIGILVGAMLFIGRARRTRQVSTMKGHTPL